MPGSLMKRRREANGLFICDICHFQMRFKDKIMNHVNGHIGNREYCCFTCEKECVQKGDLMRHMILHDAQQKTKARPKKSVRVQCFDCSKELDKSILTSHRRDKHNDGAYKCDICSLSFKRIDNMSSHFREWHIRSEDSRNCPKCGKIFKSHKLLRQHITRGCIDVKLSNDVDINCFDCENKKFTSFLALRLHRSGTHKEGDATVCDLCEKIFNLKSVLSHHIRQKHSLIRFTCSECAKTFKSYQCLTHHRDYVHSEIVESCSKCGLKFKSRIALSAHDRSAHRDRTRILKICDECNRTVLHKHLASHFQVHHLQKDSLLTSSSF
jgi:hypothetical protein